MSFRLAIAALVLVGLTVLVTTSAVSQEGPKQPSPEEMKKMMEMWIELGTPGEQHEFLGKWAGEWTSSTKMWMGGPDAPPTVEMGTTTFRPIFGGRFVVQESKGKMMGQAYEGMGLLGYDKFRKVFFGTWCDSMSTMMYSFKGSLSQDGRLLTMYGEMDEPAMGVIGRLVRYETEMVSEDEMIFTVYDLYVGEDYKAFEIEYKRKKAD